MRFCWWVWGWGRLRPPRFVGFGCLGCGPGLWWRSNAGSCAGFRGRVAARVGVLVEGRAAVVSARGRGERSEAREGGGEFVSPGPACLYPQRLRCGRGSIGEPRRAGCGLGPHEEVVGDPDELQPDTAHQLVPPTRTIGRALGMAIDHRDPQPPEAPQTPDIHRSDLKEAQQLQTPPRRPQRHARRPGDHLPTRPLPRPRTFTRHPRRAAIVAVFSRLALARGVLRLCSARPLDRCWGVRRAVARFDDWGRRGEDADAVTGPICA